jgi:hypothetical protein
MFNTTIPAGRFLGSSVCIRVSFITTLEQQVKGCDVYFGPFMHTYKDKGTADYSSLEAHFSVVHHTVTLNEGKWWCSFVHVHHFVFHQLVDETPLD